MLKHDRGFSAPSKLGGQCHRDKGTMEAPIKVPPLVLLVLPFPPVVLVFTPPVAPPPGRVDRLTSFTPQMMILLSMPKLIPETKKVDPS